MNKVNPINTHPAKFPYQLIDLTHTLDESIPTWVGDCGFKIKTTLDYTECENQVKFRTQDLMLHAGIGTHMDAPAHCIPGGATIDTLSLQQLIAPCIIIDISDRAHERYSLSTEDIHRFEKMHCPITAGDMVMVRTGWEKFWHQPQQYHNQHLFPSVSAEAAQLLLNRGVVGLGIDTLSPDRMEDDFVVHQLFLSAGCIIIENVANLAHLPPQGSLILGLPIKIKGGTEAPIRLIGLIPIEATK